MVMHVILHEKKVVYTYNYNVWKMKSFSFILFD